jgi:raffinose/stachyose/melibiose transport system permease protein
MKNAKNAGTRSVRRQKKDTVEAFKFLGMSALFIFYIMPFVLLLINSFKNKRDIVADPFALGGRLGWTFANYQTAFDRMKFPSAFGNSLFITGLSTLTVVLIASMTAWYFVRAKNVLSRVVFALMVASMIIPFQAIMIPLVGIYGAGLGILNHRLTLVFFHTGFALSMSVFMYQGFVKSGVPLSLEEAAYIDGCNKIQIFFRIVLPVLKPVTATIIILNVLAFWNDYLLPSLTLADRALLTLPLSTYRFYGTYSADYGVIMAALVLTVLPVLFLFIVLQRSIISGVLAGAVKS